MGLIRCTCVYRISTRSELDDGHAEISVSLPDPWCPAAELHGRAASPQAQSAKETPPR